MEIVGLYEVQREGLEAELGATKAEVCRKWGDVRGGEGRGGEGGRGQGAVSDTIPHCFTPLSPRQSPHKADPPPSTLTRPCP